ncbi:MAG: hypothetical protein E6Q97_06985 [Desulfurellales bacterium]|nr:MAG: hypothetical protein E6Q97_06985 [Desulfurellales bacterium]
MNKSAVKYEVEFFILVDHPEKRDASYRPVEPGTMVRTVWEYPTQSRAVAVFDSICRGDYDFGSEYVTKVRVLRISMQSSPRLVRKWVERARSVKSSASI